METSATIKYVRVSPKKVKEVSMLMHGLPVQAALDRLTFLNTKVARVLYKAIQSAVSNAVNNSKLDRSQLRIKTISVGKGPFFKRWNPVARGMAHQIKKRTTHISVKILSVETKAKTTAVKALPESKTEKASRKHTKMKKDKEGASHGS